MTKGEMGQACNPPDNFVQFSITINFVFERLYQNSRLYASLDVCIFSQDPRQMKEAFNISKALGLCSIKKTQYNVNFGDHFLDPCLDVYTFSIICSIPVPKGLHVKPIEIDAPGLIQESARSCRESEDEWRGLKPFT